MFEKLAERGERLARERAGARRRALAERLRAELPGGIEVTEDEAGARLSGRGLARRHALDPRLRGLIAGLVR